MLFSEYYGEYYACVSEILSDALEGTLTKERIREIANRMGFAESVLAIPANLSNGSEMTADNTTDADVRILGQGEVQGHSAAALDLTGDNEADVVVIDVDDSLTLNEPDVVIFREGAVTTMGDIAEGNPPVWIDEGPAMTNMENPDVAPDMPDYMDDAAMSI